MVIIDYMVFACVMYNIIYAVFNLLPVPPWDGSRIFYVFLPTKWYFGIMKYERIIMIVMLILLWTGFLTGPLSSATEWLTNGLLSLVGIRNDSDSGVIFSIVTNFVYSLIS
jgi:Zn-dependent protease